jgi:hypothetical protein
VNSTELRQVNPRTLYGLRDEAQVVLDDNTAAVESHALARMQMNSVEAELRRRGLPVTQAQLVAAMFGDGANIAKAAR